MFVSNTYGWCFSITDCCFSRITIWIRNNNSMASVSIITNSCCWSTSVNTVTTILNNKLILSSIWICNCYCVASILVFSSCCCCRFAIFTIFDDSICNITISICYFNCMSTIIVIRYFNFWSFTVFTVFNHCFFS